VETCRSASRDKAGTSESVLNRIVEPRNVIAHTGDRKGRGRAAITIAEVESDLNCIICVVDALDPITSNIPR
jgi:hypothetical protein